MHWEGETLTEQEKVELYVDKHRTDPMAYRDALAVINGHVKAGEAEWHGLNEKLRGRMGVAVREMAGQHLPGLEKMGELYNQSLLIDALVSLDAYMQYIERDREPSKRFYLPRRKVLRPIVNDLVALANGDLELMTISLPPGVGKLLADDTPVMTKDGWKRHGDLRVGDYVIGLDGGYKMVQHVFEKNKADYEIEFTNGEKIKCHGNHEWLVYDRHKQKQRLCTAEEMLAGGIESGEANKRGHRYHYMLPHVEPMVGKDAQLPVNPYLFGVWLGDGSTTKPGITICDTDTVIVDEYMREYKLTRVYDQAGCKRYEFGGLRQDLKELGLCWSHTWKEKFIPEIYLAASVGQRLDLLAGIIDTDGTLCGTCKYSISTSSTILLNGVCELVSTFGWRYCVSEYAPRMSSGGVRGTKPNYRVTFCPDMEIPCRVERKQMKAIPAKRRIAVKGIRKTAPVPGNCIQVEGGIYRVGRTMLPTHNSTLAIFYMTWLGGKNPESPILSFSHDAGIVRGMYDEILRIISPDGEYRWKDVFPDVKLTSTNAKDLRIDLGTRKRFETFQFSSIGAGNAGKLRAAQLLFCDDLVESIEQAMSKERLDKLWTQYNTDIQQRKTGECKELHIATRWSIHDVIGRLEQQEADYPTGKARFIRIPALNENDESNFDYPGIHDKFTTERYHKQRENMDDANWRALYMNEPIEREGQLYHPDELRRFFDLPEDQPDGIVAVCDTKAKGNDYCFMPILYVYGSDVYVADCVCDNGDPGIVEERLVQMLLKHKVKEAQFESNSAGWHIAEKIQDKIRKAGGITRIVTKPTTSNKETKIVLNAPAVKERCLFLDASKYRPNSDYGKAMNMLTGYTMAGRNKHDDVADGMAMAVLYLDGKTARRAEIIQRPF